MQIVSAREFRSNQSKILHAVNSGQDVILTSRLGNFKITPLSDSDELTRNICEGLKEVKLMETNVLSKKSAKAFLDEL